MSKEHQFIIKSIVRGDRTPMYLETYTLGDRGSQVYKDAMKLLGNEDAQQGISLELIQETAPINGRPLRGNIHVNDVDTATMQPTGVRNRLIAPSAGIADPAGSTDLTLEGQESFVSPGTQLAAELEKRYPNKNWKGRVNKAFDAYNKVGSIYSPHYSPHDIAVCLLSLCPNHDMESKYRELLALDYNVTVNVVRDILRLEYDHMTRVSHAMESIQPQLRPLADYVVNPQPYQPNATEKYPQVIFTEDEVKAHPEHFEDHVAIPLKSGKFAAVNKDLLEVLIHDAVSDNWTDEKLVTRVENQFRRADDFEVHQIHSEWVNEARHDEYIRRDGIQPYTRCVYSAEEMRGVEHKFEGKAILPLDRGYKAVVDNDKLQALISQSIKRGWQATNLRRRVEELYNRRDSGTWHHIEEGWFLEALRKERASLHLDKSLTAVKTEPRDFLSVSLESLSKTDIALEIKKALDRGTATEEQVTSAVFELLDYPTSYEAFITAELGLRIPMRLRELCLARFGMTEEPELPFVEALRHRYYPECLDDAFIANSVENALQKGELTLPEATDAVLSLLGNPTNVDDFHKAINQSFMLSVGLHEACVNRFTKTKHEGPHFVLGTSETQEITSVTSSTYYRNGQFKDHIAFGSQPGNRSQDDIIGVLAYAEDAAENEPDCVAVMHYQFFYQGDSVFVTDRYGNTVDRLR